MVLAKSAQFSIKKWDAKFESVLKKSLWDMGLTDKNIRSSVHEIQNDLKGEWVVHRLQVTFDKKKSLKKVIRNIERSGAQVTQMVENGNPVLLVRRHSRLYQEIKFVKP